MMGNPWDPTPTNSNDPGTEPAPDVAQLQRDLAQAHDDLGHLNAENVALRGRIAELESWAEGMTGPAVPPAVANPPFVHAPVADPPARVLKDDGTEAEAPTPKPPAAVKIGDMVAFTSDAGAQYGTVIELTTIDHGDGESIDAACVAWVTGGESGPIPTEQLEVR